MPLLAAAALVLLPAEERTLRVGVVRLRGRSCLALALVHTQVGANAARLGSLFGGPVLALGLAGRRPVALAILALPLLYWQWAAPVRDLANGRRRSLGEGRPTTRRSSAELERRTAGRPVRVEIPPTRIGGRPTTSHRTFRSRGAGCGSSSPRTSTCSPAGNLTPAAYRTWLYDNGVSYVALPDADPDYLAEDEDALIRSSPSYLHPVWSESALAPLCGARDAGPRLAGA